MTLSSNTAEPIELRITETFVDGSSVGWHAHDPETGWEVTADDYHDALVAVAHQYVKRVNERDRERAERHGPTTIQAAGVGQEIRL